MFSVESEHAERARTLRRRGLRITGLGFSLWQLWSHDWLPFPAWMAVAFVAASVVVQIFGNWLVHRGKQFEALEEAAQVFGTTPTAQPVADRVEAARRPTSDVQFERDPVLYLRAFGVDAGPGTGVLGFLSFDADSSGATSLEEQLSSAVESIGPLIAIGQPGEPLPTPGAARRYVPADAWQETVRSWMARARLVILRPDCTPGVAWEIDTALSMVRPGNLLLLIVRMRRQKYEATQVFMRERGIALPSFETAASLGRVSAFFAFDDQHRVHRIPLSAPFWRGPDFGLWKKRFHYALRPLFERHDLLWIQPPVRKGLISLFLFILAGLAVVILLSQEEPYTPYSPPPWLLDPIQTP